MKYALYGLTLDSELPLDGIDTSNRPADARLRFGETPLRLESPRASGPWGDANPGRVLLRIGDIARFLVVDGREILATPLKDSTPAELGFFLMQGVIGVLLHQRGVLPLHASAVQIGGRTIAVAGHAGAGKSTLLLECVRRGGRIVTDDLAALSIGPSEPVRIISGFPRVHVWRETLDRFNMPVDGLAFVREGIHKFRVPGAAADAQPTLSAIACVEVRHRAEIACERLEGTAAFAAVRSYMRGRRITEALNLAGDFARLAHVANTVPIFRVTRPESGPSTVERVADHIVALGA